MKLIKKQNGYTITETLIVLAVTGVLFVTTTLLIQGQVEKNRYQDSMRQMQQISQQAAKDTENGYFPGATGTSDDGSVFVGKRISFCGGNGAGVTDGCNDRTQMRVENLKTGAGGTIVTTGAPEYSTLPGGVTYIGSYNYKTGGDKKSYTNGVVMRFSSISYGTDDSIAVEYEKVNKYQYMLMKYTSSLLSPAAIGISPIGGGSRPTPAPAPPDKEIIIVGPPAPAEIIASPSCLENNVYCTPSSAVQQSVGIVSYNATASTDPIAFCFDGYRKGSLVFGINGGNSVELLLDDQNCNSGF